MSRRCPETGTTCFDPGCVAGCQGYDVHIEAITVVHTTIRRRAAVSLVYGGGYQPKPSSTELGEPNPPPKKP